MISTLIYVAPKYG